MTGRLELVVIKVETGHVRVTVDLAEYSGLVINMIPVTVLTGCYTSRTTYINVQNKRDKVCMQIHYIT